MVLLLLPVAPLVRLYKRQNTQALAELRQARIACATMARPPPTGCGRWERTCGSRTFRHRGAGVAGERAGIIGKTRLEIARSSWRRMLGEA